MQCCLIAIVVTESYSTIEPTDFSVDSSENEARLWFAETLRIVHDNDFVMHIVI